jgi:regulation of enolase protein 1 (concanavalin A-like superfamily)
MWMVMAVVAIAVATARPAAAQTTKLGPQERLCDPAFEDCRADILTYIAQETVQIDMGYWMMTDARYSNALVAAWQRGVKIRLLMDPRCVLQHPTCKTQNDQLAAAGIPMRNRLPSGILHWKMIIFASQGQMEFAGANYAPFELSPDIPYVNYTDEVVMFTNNLSLLHSFESKFDDLWTSTTEFGWFANALPSLTRSYPTATQDPQLNFPPEQSYRTRALAAYSKETLRIDVQMFRITDEQESNGMISALGRGVPVRLVTDETEYRDPTRLWDAYNVDKMYHAGVTVKFDGHQGIDHEKAVLLVGSGMMIIGSSNWTSPSSDSQREHNMFSTQPWMVTWLHNQFERKWNNLTGNIETKPFVPLPPDVPTYNTPANAASGIATSAVVLKWYAGPWGQLYDIYFGTTPNPPLLAADQKLGPSQSTTDYRTYALPALQAGTTYYWKIVSKTMALQTAAGPVWSFTTAGAPPPPPPSSTLPSGWSNADVGATGVTGNSTFASPTFTVQGGGADVWGTADAFQYAFTTLTGDGTIVARVATVQNVNAWVKAGVMIRNSLNPSAAQGFMLVSAAKGLAFQRRVADGNISVSSTGSLSSAPRWVKLARSGSTITAFESADGTTWTQVGSDTFTMGATVDVGLAVSSHVAGTLATATFDNVAVSTTAPPPPPPGNSPPTVSLTSPTNGAMFTAPATITVSANAADSDGTVAKVDFFAGTTPIGTATTAPYSITWSNVAAGTYSLTAVATDNAGASTTSSAVSITVNPAPSQGALPAGWLDTDVGSVPFAGSASFASNTFSVTGSGADVWGSADAFHYAYTSLSGDGTVVAQVATVQNVNAWVKAGVMIRETLAAGSAHAFMLVSAAKGVAFQRRVTPGGLTTNTAGSLSTAPRWVKLTRVGDTFSAFESPDGVTWTLVGTDTIPMSVSVFVGLAVTSHTTTASSTCTFTNVTIQ